MAVVKRFKGLALLATLIALSFQALMVQNVAASSPVAAAAAVPSKATPAPAGVDQRSGSLDVILLIDKSLSMASCMGEVKSYVAGTILLPLLIPGDRLIVEAVYGKVDRLVKTDISSQADIANAIRAIRELKANGHYTDLGKALDAAKRDLDELGKPERPKYVLLVTDERQEAPKDSPYQASDHKLKHPSLQYMKRVDLGKFRAITVGLQVAEKVDAAAPGLMKLLEDPPVRVATDSIGEGGAAVPGQNPEKGLPSWLLVAAAILLLVALASLLVVLLVSKKKKGKEEEKAAA